jgi:adenine-specific DNA methylase
VFDTSNSIEVESVDAVVTDPPFFDNVHYSRLADFFYVWQRHILGPDGVRETKWNETGSIPLVQPDHCSQP